MPRLVVFENVTLDIDEYQIVVNPVIIGKGGHCSKGSGTSSLSSGRRRAFANGSVLLCYEK